MPPKQKAVTVPDARRTSNRTRDRQLQTAAQPLCNADPKKSKAESSAPKQNAAKKRGPWGEDYLLSNPKSVLVDADLVRLFSNPEAWNRLEEEEKREILALMPAHIHPNPDPDPENPDHKIPPLPEKFLRYDNNWRGALRDFQADLEAGRYTPEWQQQAKQAVKERAEGKFDDFKEREFEEFWGQKQKINPGLIAGESSKVKLETLIRHNVVRVDDVWKYCRVFGSKKTGIVVEKEARIIDIDGTNLSFLVPTGQRVFLRAVGEKKPGMGRKANDGAATLKTPLMQIETDAMEIDDTDADSIDLEMGSNIAGNSSDRIKAPRAIAAVRSLRSDAPNEAVSESNSDSAMDYMSLETTIRNIAGPNALAKKILEIDGRIESPPNGKLLEGISLLQE